MKKSLIIVLAALVLICAVSCNDAKKNIGTLELDFKNYKNFIDPEDLADLDSIKIRFAGEQTMEISKKDLKRGIVSINVPAGFYEVSLVYLDAENSPLTDYGPRFCEASELVNGIYGTSRITVDAGQTTFCKLGYGYVN